MKIPLIKASGKSIYRLTAVLLLIVAFSATASAHHLDPPIALKFCVYGDAQKMHTEVKGIVIAIDGSDLFVKPDHGYMHLLLEGNRRRPKIHERGRDFYNTISPNEITPMILLETYGVGTWLTSGGKDAPHVNDKGTRRLLQEGDHIKVTGFYVTDNAHSMYHNRCTISFSYMRGLYKSCYAHAELHPYDYESIELVPELQPGEANVETHSLVAPVYMEYYSRSFAWNELWGVDGKLVDASIQEVMSAEWYLDAPPLPIGAVAGKTHSLKIEETILFKPVDMPMHQIEQSGNGYRINVSVRGADIHNPALFQAKYKVYWSSLEQ